MNGGDGGVTEEVMRFACNLPQRRPDVLDHLQAIDPISQLLEMEKNKSVTLLNYMSENGFQTVSLSV